MNYFKPSGTFENAIETSDVEAIKALLVGIIGADPTFATSEFQEAFNYVKSKKKSMIIEEEYQKQSDEHRINDPDKWNEKYFQMNLVWLRDNFNISNRLEHIREVGQEAYAEKNTIGKSKIKQLQSGNSKEKKERIVRTTVDDVSVNRLNSKKDSFNWNYFWISLGVIVALALISFAICKFVNS